jgi:hypothetical protein
MAVKLAHFFDSRDAVARASRHPGFTGVQGPFNTLAVFQLLAKIAHGMMFISFDVSNIRPLLSSMIVGNTAENDWWKFIGLGPDLDQAILEPTWAGAHQLKVQAVQHENGRNFVLVDICLFPVIPGARLQVPTYRVVAGECPEEPHSSSWPAYQKRSSYF